MKYLGSSGWTIYLLRENVISYCPTIIHNKSRKFITVQLYGVFCYFNDYYLKRREFCVFYIKVQNSRLT